MLDTINDYYWWLDPNIVVLFTISIILILSPALIIIFLSVRARKNRLKNKPTAVKKSEKSLLEAPIRPTPYRVPQKPPSELAVLSKLQNYPVVLGYHELTKSPAHIYEYTSKNFIRSTNLNKVRTFIAFDLETSGLKPYIHEIVQIGAIKYVDFSPTEKFVTYIKPNKPIPYDTTRVNNITNEMVGSAPRLQEVYDSFMAFIGDAPLVGHNAEKFDIPFFEAHGFRVLDNDRIFYDTYVLSRRAFPGADSYSLTNICKEVGIPVYMTHDALADSWLCGELFVRIICERKDIPLDQLRFKEVTNNAP